MSISETLCPDSRTLGRALCIITGASRGFGRALTHQLASLLQPGSTLIVVARSGDQLLELKEDLGESMEMEGLVVCCVAADLSEREGLEETVRAAKEEAMEDIDHVLLINNAGSLGDVSRFVQSFTDPEEVNSYLSFNVSSALGLTAGILQAFPRRQGLRRSVVNISSLCALQAMPSWVLYCTAKAARDMMFRVLAVEEPDLRVLNYAPGPLDTEMQEEARQNTGNLRMRLTWDSMHTQGQLLTCQESGAKLMKLLLDDDFPSGAHIDFYEL
ncbi:sepiapterin reductase b [Aplochiton taeniatus]